jgi:1-carboxybiuret hydrolase
MSDPQSPWAAAAEVAKAVKHGVVSARVVAEAVLDRVPAENPALNAFTDVTTERALAEAEAVDAVRRAGEPLGPLAGVPYSVKNLFDIEGLPTRAGSKINRELPPSRPDAALIRRLKASGAVLLGALNMGEYAYDFTGENAHDGASRNPHDLERMTGGSSSWSAAAVAAGLGPLSLGFDTNGSLRAPASLCGVFSLKPSYGRLTRAGTFPFVDSLDHLGPFSRSVRDLALAYDAMQGPDAEDHACAARPFEAVTPVLGSRISGLRCAVLGGWFEENAGPEARAAVSLLAGAPRKAGRVAPVTLPKAPAGRSAAYLITNSESSGFHLERLRARAADYDPDTRDRFLAGTLLPAAWVARAQRVRRW